MVRLETAANKVEAATTLAAAAAVGRSGRVVPRPGYVTAAVTA